MELVIFINIAGNNRRQQQASYASANSINGTHLSLSDHLLFEALIDRFLSTNRGKFQDVTNRLRMPEL